MSASFGRGPFRVLTLLRHASAELAPGQKEGDLFSLGDLPLSAKGRAEAEGARELLREARFDAAYASPSVRAWETAAIVVEPHGLSVEPVPELREMPFGEAGMGYAEVLDEIVGLAYALADGRDPVLRDGRPYSAEKARFAAALAAIVARHERPLVVAHGIQNRVWLADLLGMPPWALFRLGQDHAAVNVVEYDGERATLAALNRR